jgi:hypothetical protein
MPGDFAQLPPVTQQWYANAPYMLASIRAQWPLLDQWHRNALLQQWAMELPQMLWMVDPVLERRRPPRCSRLIVRSSKKCDSTRSEADRVGMKSPRAPSMS